jgi:hypothetical protein
MVWYGMVRHGKAVEVWCGMVRYGMVRHGRVDIWGLIMFSVPFILNILGFI